MLRKSWIALIAVIGVLLHAGALVRHHGSMLSVASGYSSLVADLSIICHGGAASLAAGDHDAPARPSEPSTNCPICLGMTPAGMIVPDLPRLVAPRIVVAASPHAAREFSIARHLAERTRARDPPSFHML